MFLSILISVACKPISMPQPQLHGEGFFGHPWPSDLRTIDGHLDLSDFPHNDEFALLSGFLELGSTMTGYGTNSPIYVGFNSPIDTLNLPTPEASLNPDASLFVINVDPTSEQRGQQVPVEWQFQTEETTWQPRNLLSVRPVWGFPLSAQTKYALVVTTQVAEPAQDFAAVWETSHPNHEHYTSLQETLTATRFPLEQVAIATIFTTQDPVWEVAQISKAIHEQIEIPDINQQLDPWLDNGIFSAHEGQLVVPLWQHGDKPYSSEGGQFVFDENDQPILATWEQTTFGLSIPTDHDMPDEGWPVVIYSHGTGGDHRSFTAGSGNTAATVLSISGMAVISISQPLHGDRGSGVNPSLYSFNYINPIAGQTMFRQGALDQVFMAELMSSAQHEFTTSEGELIRLDPNRVAYMGHSHGGVVGAMAAPFFGDRIAASVLSGAGGGFSITLIERDAGDFDIPTLITTALDFEDHEVMDTFHPTIALIQMIAEPTDPINYSPFWHNQEPWWGGSPASVLQTEGLLDTLTPPKTTEALAGAARTPILSPTGQTSLVQEITGLYDDPTPTSGNTIGWNGHPVSAGLAQYPNQGHYAVFRETDAAHLYSGFLASALDGDQAEIGSP